MDNNAIYYRISKLYDNFDTNAGVSGRYFFMYDIKQDVARWSPEAVTDFSLPGEFIHHQSQVLSKIMAPEDESKFREDMKAITEGRLEKKETEWYLRHKDGEYIPCNVKFYTIKDYAKIPTYIAVIITSQSVDSHLDPVSGLPNQVKFLEHLRQLFSESKRATILLVGTSDFAQINTLYGYTFGNKVIRALADHLKTLTAGVGELFRGEGTMLLFCSESLSTDEMRRIYKEQRAFAMHMLSVDSTIVPVRLNAGIVVADDPSVDLHAILTCAKYAQSLSATKDDDQPVVLHNDHLNDNSRTLELVNAIRSDIENRCRNFSLYYQPIMCTTDNSLMGSAAYLRWKSDPYGGISPAEFLLWLENDESFSQLGNWILKQAITQGKEMLTKHPDLIININLAHRQLEQPEFHQFLLNTLHKEEFPGKNLCLELTDRCRFMNPDFLRHEIIFFKSCGILVALDGSCLLDLHLVRTLPVDIIKIGRDFTASLKKSDKDRALLKALCSFAKESGIRVCAEGIEDPEMLAMIREYDIIAYQGFVAAPPMPFSEFTRLPLF